MQPTAYTQNLLSKDRRLIKESKERSMILKRAVKRTIKDIQNSSKKRSRILNKIIIGIVKDIEKISQNNEHGYLRGQP